VYGRFEKEPTMGEEGKGAKPFDPMEPWRGVRDVYLDAWAKSMVEMVNTEAYAQATGTMLDTYLTASAPFREAVEKAMLKTLEQLAMPTRADVVSIAERMTNIEMRLDDLDAKLDVIRKLIAGSTSAPPTESRRAAQATRKVVAKKSAKKGKK
jgi:polyhydroxyalkanoic acid synthase PhaR subunit